MAAYGRLDVYWQDGLFRTFPLSESSVSVGRSSGNTIMLDNSTISRYHFSLTINGEIAYISDLESANGTYVDGVKLASNTPHPLGGGEEIQIGNLRMIYHHIDESPTQLMTPVEETTQRVELSRPEFNIDVHGPDQSVAPGAHIAVELSIANTSDMDQRFTIEIAGTPKEWVRIDRPTPLVDAGDTTFVLINFKPLRRSDSKPGDYPVTIRVYPHDKPTAVIETTIILQVKPFGGFGMSLGSNKLRRGERFQLHLHNQGSANLPLSINGRDLTDSLRFNIPMSFVTLAPGQQATIQGEVMAKRSPLLGSPREVPFDLTVRANNHAGFVIGTRGYFLEKPMLPRWTFLFAIGGLALLGLAVVIVLAVILTRPAPEPNIAVFEVNSTLIARGDPLEISWQATDVAQIYVSLNGTPAAVGTTSPQSSSLIVDTSGLSGEVELLFEGQNGDQTDIRSQTIHIYQPMTIEYFTAAPDQVVRYVVQSTTIDWNAPEAVLTQLTGLEKLNVSPIEVAGANGSFQLAEILTEPVTLTLRAQDAFGNIMEQMLTINVMNPECRPASAPASLHFGPDLGHQVVGTVPADTTVVVDAQDASGQWLRVSGLSGGLNGWGKRTDFTCNDNFNVEDLRKELNVPPPPPTITPLPAPTSTPSPTPPITPTTAG
jgi:FHA domain